MENIIEVTLSFSGVIPDETHILLKVHWYPHSASLVDEVSKNIFLIKDMPKEESFIAAESIECQVSIAPVPFPPRRLHRYNRRGIMNNLDANMLDREDTLCVVLDKVADFFKDLDDDYEDD